MGFGRSEHNKRFEHQSAANLAQSLASLEQVLYKPCDLTELAGIIKSQNVTDLYRAFHPGDYEKEGLQHLMENCDLEIHTAYSLSLLHESQLPFGKDKLPKTFTQFRKQVENLAVVRPLPSPDALPQHIELDVPRVCMLSEVNASIFYQSTVVKRKAKNTWLLTSSLSTLKPTS